MPTPEPPAPPSPDDATPVSEAVQQAVAAAHRQEWAAVLASTVRVARDLDLAEECVQEAYLDALSAWQRQGIPDRPGAWLTVAARRNALDALRRARTARDRQHLLIEPEATEQHLPVSREMGRTDARASEMDMDTAVHDDRLRLIFLCCHPALSREAQVALTLRLVCGVSTPDVAHAFLVSEATMAARITRAKKKIAGAHIPFRMPAPDELPDRLEAVLTVIHLLFTTGHTAPSGESLTRDDLSERALDLARLLHALLPDEREVRGLLALLLVNHARRATRAAPDGRLLLLEEQDRAQWDRTAIAEGDQLVLAALRGGGSNPGRFTLQAAIAALHASAPTYADTDWPQILLLYNALLRAWPSPVVDLNRAIVLGMVDGPDAALVELDRIDAGGSLASYHYLPAVRADHLRRLARWSEAADAYRAALVLVDNAAERRFLEGRLAEVSAF